MLTLEPEVEGSKALIMGCSGFAGIYEPVDEAFLLAAVEKALEKSIDTFDVAPHYGCGLAESRLGQCLYKLSCRRTIPSLFVWTKVGRLVKDLAQIDEAVDQIEYSNCNCLGYSNSVFPDTPSDKVPVIDFTSAGSTHHFC